MVQTSFVFLAALLPVVFADGPQAGWGPGGGGPGPGWGPGNPPPWAPGRPGGPWQTAAPGPAPQDPGCTARPACDQASAAARSCSSRAAATGGTLYNDCLCQAGPSAAIQQCYAGCFGAGGPNWLVQCVPATAPAGGAVNNTYIDRNGDDYWHRRCDFEAVWIRAGPYWLRTGELEDRNRWSWTFG
ncbi:hypothetical protein OQA88_661 [Cercophora sp. LCS_1]